MGIEKEYNKEIEQIAKDRNFRRINHFVMDHTYSLCTNNEKYMKEIDNTNKASYIVKQEDDLNVKPDGKTTNIIVSKKRTYEAAKAYNGKKIAVLNFANNHSIGGAPWSAGAQEESLCRISTLYPCLEKFKKEFYQYHKDLYMNGKMDELGNDDLIYLPNIMVFKTDESVPKLMEDKDCYYVDVITSAAPDLAVKFYDWNEYRILMYNRLKKIIQVAKKENVDIFILGAYGCGAFHNPPEIIASLFKELLNEYHFDTVEFAVYCYNDDKFSNYNVFKNILEN